MVDPDQLNALASKQSHSVVVTIGPGGRQVCVGAERGPARFASHLGALGPAPPGEGAAPEREATLALAERLAWALRRSLPELAARLSLRVEEALVAESHTAEPGRGGPAHIATRRVTSASLSFDERRGASRFARSVALLPGAEGWPEGFLEAFERALLGAPPLGRAGEHPAPIPAPPFERAGRLALDAFALAELLRLAGRRWLLDEPAPGVALASAALTLRDPGYAFPALGDELDALAHPVRPYRVLERGRLLDAAWLGAAERGAFVRTSWREQPSPGWRSLAVEEPPASARGALPSELGEPLWLVTRLLVVGSTLLATGSRHEPGRAPRPFRPRPAPPPECWLRALESPFGPPILELSGLPVSTPGFLVAASTLPTS